MKKLKCIHTFIDKCFILLTAKCIIFIIKLELLLVLRLREFLDSEMEKNKKKLYFTEKQYGE